MKHLSLILIACIFIQTDAFQITLYGPKNVKPKNMFIANYCQKIPKEISANLRYVHTNNNCVLLWEDEHCKVNSLSIITNPIRFILKKMRFESNLVAQQQMYSHTHIT